MRCVRHRSQVSKSQAWTSTRITATISPELAANLPLMRHGTGSTIRPVTVRDSDPHSPTDPRDPDALRVEFTALLAELRSAVSAAVSPRCSPGLGARELARRLEFDKTSGWRVFELAHDADDVTALRMLPGLRSWTKLISALRALGASADESARLEDSVKHFEAFIARHRLARNSLALWFVPSDNSKNFDAAATRIRKLAVEAARAITGLHLQARIGCYLIAPSADPCIAALAALTIIEGPERAPGHPDNSSAFKVYVPVAFWKAPDELLKQGFDPSSPLQYPLIADLSSPGLASDEVSVSRPPSKRCFELRGRRASRREPLYMSFAEFNHAAGPLFAPTSVTAESTAAGTASGASEAADDDDVQFGMPIDHASDIAVFDVAIHKDVVLASAPRVGLYFTRLPKDASGMFVIPINSPVRCAAHLHEIDRLDLPTSLAHRDETYAALLTHGATELGTRVADYRFFRVVIEYPPQPSIAVISWTLPPAR